MTYQEWLDVCVKTYRDMSSSQYLGIIGGLDLHDFIDGLTDSKAVSLRKTVAINGNISFDPEGTLGIENVKYLDFLSENNPDEKAKIDQFKVMVEKCCCNKSFPNAGKSEAYFNKITGKFIETTIPPTTKPRNITIRNEVEPTEPTEVIVKQRISSDGIEWSEWHDALTFNNVKYPAQSHTLALASTTAEYRELKACCAVEIGMSIE